MSGFCSNPNPPSVIPAEAGIHVGWVRQKPLKGSVLDSSFRRNDGWEAFPDDRKGPVLTQKNGALSVIGMRQTRRSWEAVGSRVACGGALG